jgi:hypothetical protein
MSKKTLVLYVFHIFNERVEYFINNCIFYDDNTDFIIISNSLEKIDKFTNIKIPSYVKVIYRENIGYDFGGWSEAILTNNLYKNYDYFIFANSSIIGPFLRDDFKGKWTDIYINGLKTGANTNVKLFGSTININCNPLKDAHVQSYIYSTDKEGLQHLIDTEIFSLTNIAPTFQDAIWGKEVIMSRKIIEKGWNIASLLPCYKNVDFTIKNDSEYKRVLCSYYYDDVMYEKFRNVLWNEYDLVFIKGNRISIFPPQKNAF